ncbi:MAG TPA: hypothetical protein VFN67_26465 [Polyangiales bacterium]|nr:hypothetical protein [Polyangiales bacterium]
MKSSGAVALSLENPATPTVEVTEVSAYPGVHSSFVWQNVAITVWFGPATMQSLVEFDKGCRSFCGKHPEGISSVHIMVPGGKSMPTAEARAEVGRIMRENAKTTAAAAALVPGNGFWASALRSMVTAILMLAPRSFAFRMFGELSELADWLAPLHSHGTGVEVQPVDLLRALRHVHSTALRLAA